MIMDFPQGTIEFRSDKKDKQDVLSSILSKMTEKTFNVKMGKNGKIIEVNNIESQIESLIKDLPQLPENQLAQIKAQIINAYGEKAFKGSYEMITAIYPDRPVKQGDKWTIHANLESGMSALMTTEYELTDLRSNYAIVKGNSQIETADKDAYVPINGMPTRHDLAGSMSSEIKVDKSTGWIIEAHINQKIAGDTYIQANAELPNGMKIPITIKTEMTYNNN